MPRHISSIDAYAAEAIYMPTSLLIERAGHALASCVKGAVGEGSAVLILVGNGHNGADGYAAGRFLLEEGYRVTIVDLMGRGQRSEAAKRVADTYVSLPDAVLYTYSPDKRAEKHVDTEGLNRLLEQADLVIDAVFGTGFKGELPISVQNVLYTLSNMKKRPYLLAADLPMGVFADTGEVHPLAVPFDQTLMLSFPKLGLYSYPARRFCGRLSLDTLGLPIEKITEHFGFDDRVIDQTDIKEFLPPREQEGHKGSYGTLGMLCGSDAYPGAALLAASSALHMGVGLVRAFGNEEMRSLMLTATPEVVFTKTPSLSSWSEEYARHFFEEHSKVSAWLVGCGAGVSDGLASCLRVLLTTEGAPIVLDADALNTIAIPTYGLRPLLGECPRQTVLTPHPLEFARLFGHETTAVNQKRLTLAKKYASKYKLTILLKGAGSVIAMKTGAVYINTSGNSSLSKGGSGDVLAGAIASFAAMGMPLEKATAVAMYLHGRAGEKLSEKYSEYGVLPSELPKMMAKEILVCQK